MNKYFTEYPKNQLYTCFDVRDMFVNFKFDYNGNEYLFIHLIHKNSESRDGIKTLLKLKDKNSALYLIFCMVIDNFNLHSKKYESGEFKYSLLHDKDFNLKEKNIQILVYVMMIVIMIPLI